MHVDLSRSPPLEARSAPSALPPGSVQVGRSLREAVTSRDDHACAWCGFRSMKYQEVVTCGANPRDVASMRCACAFCHQCMHLDAVGAMRSGVLIWLPEITQGELHHVARELYVARIRSANEDSPSVQPKPVLDALMSRRAQVRSEIGSDDPKWLAAQLADGALDGAAVRAAQYRGLRLFPLERRIIREAELEFNQFPQMLAYWRSQRGPYAAGVPLPWVERAQVLLQLPGG